MSVVFAVAGAVGWTSGAFSSAADNAGNSFQAATSFCVAPGTVTVTSDTDSYVASATPTTNYGSAPDLWVGSSVNFGNARALVAFPMPAMPANCTVTSATLRVNSVFSSGARTIQVFRAAATWSGTTVTWNTQPATTGTAATTTAAVGWNTWTVTSQVQAIYSGSDFGFILRDQTESAAGDGFWQQYQSLNSTTDPELLVTFG
ncbi:MAG: DNRLRE domain-containing protein [Actinomycetota bacterium]